MRIKISDYIFQFLESKNINTAFSVSGGAAAHLLESIRQSGINYIPNYHEQASAMSAEPIIKEPTAVTEPSIIAVPPSDTNVWSVTSADP